MGRRSSVFIDGDGRLLRRYHDTGATHPAPLRLTASAGFRGEQRIPPHLERAMYVLLREPQSIDEFAQLCRVKVSTAWNYASRVAEYFPETNVQAARMVYQPLLPALLAVDATGTLGAVMERLNAGPLRGDIEWRCIDDRLAHIRLARLCLW